MALTCVPAVGIAVGGIISDYLPLEWIRRGAAVSFILKKGVTDCLVTSDRTIRITEVQISAGPNKDIHF